MKRILAICALAGLLAACTTEAVPERMAVREAQTLTLTASQEVRPGTRTVLQDETKVYWQTGDEVKLFYDGTSARFTSTHTEPAAVAPFTGTLQVLIGFNGGFDP